MHVHFVCTANTCRSPMAEALFVTEATRRALDDVRVSSSGLLPGGQPVNPDALRALGDASPVVADRSSVQLADSPIESADLVLAMTNQHAHGVVSQLPELNDRVFLLRSFERQIVSRGPNQSITQWISELQGELHRGHLNVFGDSAIADDVADPIGKGIDAYRLCATEFENFATNLLNATYPQFFLG